MASSATISPPSVPSVAPPRVRSVPDYAWSAGPQAIELAAEAGLILDGWQALIVTDQLGMRDDGRFAAFECGDSVPRQNGKGGIIEARKLAGLYLLGERLVMYTAHQFKTAQEHFLRMKDYVRNSDELGRRVKRIHESHGEEGIELYGEGRNRLTGTQRLLYVARSKGSGRGFTGGCLILDEAQYLTAKQIAALFPTMSALSVTGNPQVLYHGTPPDPEESADAGSYWMSVRRRGLAGSKRLCWHEYSPEEGYDRADPEVWRATNPALSIRISEEFVQSELDAMTAAGEPDKFDRERLGVWPPDLAEGWRVIPRADWETAHDGLSEPTDPVGFGIAANPSLSWFTIGVAGLRGDGLRHLEVVDRRPGPGWVVDRAVDLVRKWNPCALVVCQSGPAGVLIPDLEAAGLTVVKASQPDYAKASAAMYTGISGRREPGTPDEPVPDPRVIRYTGTPEYVEALTVAVRAAVKQNSGDVWSFDRDVQADNSPLEAVALANLGHTLNAHLHARYDVLDSVQ